MRFPCLKFFLVLGLLVGLAGRALAQAPSEDFEFYKKYGHHSKQWDDYVKQGFDAYDQQNCDQALTALKQAVAAQCQDALVYYKLAVCSEVQGTPYTALQYYQLAEEKLGKLEVLHRYQKDIFESYGRALFQAKRFDEAFPYLVRAAAVGTPSFGLYYMVGFLYAKKNDTKAAAEFFDKALSQDTSKAPPSILALVYREVAKTYLRDKNYDKANELLGKVLAINPNDQEAIQLRNQASNALSQQSILQMIQSAEGQVGGNSGGANPSKPPPPAAAKLPPLDSGTAKDPTPPLGTVQGPASPGSSGGTTLQPLPPPPPPK
ncbi:MAG: tetratricopeptide repeat protein [bacterium]